MSFKRNRIAYLINYLAQASCIAHYLLAVCSLVVKKEVQKTCTCLYSRAARHSGILPPPPPSREWALLGMSTFWLTSARYEIDIQIALLLSISQSSSVNGPLQTFRSSALETISIDCAFAFAFATTASASPKIHKCTRYWSVIPQTRFLVNGCGVYSVLDISSYSLIALICTSQLDPCPLW